MAQKIRRQHQDQGGTLFDMFNNEETFKIQGKLNHESAFLGKLSCTGPVPAWYWPGTGYTTDIVFLLLVLMLSYVVLLSLLKTHRQSGTTLLNTSSELACKH